MTKKPLITKQQLTEALDYNPQTGEFRWTKKLNRDPSIANVGDLAGGPTGDGYMRINLFGSRFKAHRLAWLYVYGKWPNGDIDHLNGNGMDNRIENLRDVSRSVNFRNRPKQKNNTSGCTGVGWYKITRRWRAGIRGSGGEWIHLGYFKDKKEAAKARKQAELEHGYTQRHGL